MAKFTIADLEIERNEDPFEIEMDDGKTFVLKHPQSLPFADIIQLGSMTPLEQVKAVMGGHFADFTAYPEVDGYFFDALIEKYMAHYGLKNPGEAGASPRSLSGTARRSKQTSRSAA